MTIPHIRVSLVKILL